MSDIKIRSIISDYIKQIKNKDIIFGLLLRLKQSIEFNSTIDWKQLYTELGDVYKDYKPYYNSGKYTPDPIDKSTMTENDVFVFGSNTKGIHGAGAAKVAVDYYGAIYGQASGLQGNSYAIITKDLSKGERSIDLDVIEKQLDELILFAVENEDKTFWITKIGCGLGGYQVEDIAKLFANKLIPENLILPKEFVLPQYYHKYFYSNKNKKFIHVKNDNHIVVVNVGNLKEIVELKENDIISSLPNDIVFCEKDDFLLATEEVLKNLFN